MLGGFAVPAQSGVSGIQSFIAIHRVVVHERSLWPDTMRIARGITGFDRGPGWTAVAQ